MLFDDWDNSFTDFEMVKKIEGYYYISSDASRFPGFDGAEVLNINLDRGNTIDFVTGDTWEGRVASCMTVQFLLSGEESLVFKKNKGDVVSFSFLDIDDVLMSGFNYQNAICGLGIRGVYSERLRKKMFRVDWGGGALGHKVSLVCSKVRMNRTVISKK